MQHRKKKASVVEIVPAARALTHDAIANFVRVALLWHLQTAMELRKVRAAERQERTDPGQPKARSGSHVELCFFVCSYGRNVSAWEVCTVGFDS